MPAKFEVPTFSRFGADRQTDGNRPIRDDRVVNGDHAVTPTCRTYDIRDANDFRVFQCAANAVHCTDNKIYSTANGGDYNSSKCG